MFYSLYKFYHFLAESPDLYRLGINASYCYMQNPYGSQDRCLTTNRSVQNEWNILEWLYYFLWTVSL